MLGVDHVAVLGLSLFNKLILRMEMCVSSLKLPNHSGARKNVKYSFCVVEYTVHI